MEAIGVVEEAYAELAGTVRAQILRGESMQRHTGLRVGGPAALCATVDDISSLRCVTETLGRFGVPWVIMGRGTSVLVSDEGYEGAVLMLGSEFRRISVDDQGVMHVGAGAVLQRVVAEAFNRGISGLEFAAGIPGTVGGAVSMNAGEAHGWMGSLVEQVVTYRPAEGLVRYSGRDISWYDGCCDIPAREVVLEVVLSTSPADAAAVRHATDAALERRKARWPLDARSSGPVFRDLARADAADVIDSCALAGTTAGGAQIPPGFANSIVNRGGATSADVTSLIVRVREEVSRARGIELQPQIKFLGFAS